MPKVVSWRKLRFRFDWTLTVSATICFCLGLLNLWSAVRERQFNLFAQQLSWLAGGALIFLAVASIDYRIISARQSGQWLPAVVRPWGLSLAAFRIDEGQHRHGHRPSPRRRRDLAPLQLRWLQRPLRHARPWPRHERFSPPIRVLRAGVRVTCQLTSLALWHARRVNKTAP